MKSIMNEEEIVCEDCGHYIEWDDIENLGFCPKCKDEDVKEHHIEEGKLGIL